MLRHSESTAKKIGRKKRIKINKIISKQITEDKKLITTLDQKYTSAYINAGDYILGDLINMLAQHTSNFAGKRYVPSDHPRIIAYLKIRARNSGIPLPGFLTQSSKIAQSPSSAKRRRILPTQRAWTYLMNDSSSSSPTTFDKGKSKGKGRGKGRGKGKGKGKDTGKGRSLADNDYFEQPTKRPRLHERKAQSVEITELPDDSEDTIDSDTRSQSSQKSRQSSSSNRTVLRVHGTNTPDTPETSNTNPDPKIYYYCAYHGFNLSHHGHACRVMSNDDSYNSQQKQAPLPSDCNPRGNDAVEPQRHSKFLKSWGRYTK
jgi:hypothetical protein